MKNNELLKLMDNELLEKLFGFCYVRTDNSFDAQDLCSDIILELLKTADREGDIVNPYPYIWRVARNVYSRYSSRRALIRENTLDGDTEDILRDVADGEDSDIEADADRLRAVYRRIAFLTKAYREVMIMFYLEGLSTAEIARRQHTGETAIRQRLFSARKKIRNEVEEMSENINKPVALDKIDFIIWGTGNPNGNDPRNICTRQFSNHIVHLCGKKPMTAAEIAEELNVPTLYVEEELEILEKGENGEYGLIRKLNGGRYELNFILMDKNTVGKAHKIYTDDMPKVCSVITDFIKEHKEEYLEFPYLNRKIDWNLILWQQITELCNCFPRSVEKILSEKYFPDAKRQYRIFTVYGYENNGKSYGGGMDNVNAQNVCGYSLLTFQNIYMSHIKPHFHCGLNISEDIPLQIALRAINGLNIDSLSENEREAAAKSVECGYVYREDNMLYTKILVSDNKDYGRLFDISGRLSEGYFEKQAEETAAKIAELIRNTVPKHLLGDWAMANRIASMPVLDHVVDELINRGMLTPPEDGIGAEGCWMSVSK